MPTESWPVLLAVSVLLCTALAALPTGSRHKRAAPGRVVAVVSARVGGVPDGGDRTTGATGAPGARGAGGQGDGVGSAAEGLYATVRSLTGQSRPVDAVHVVDSGSAAPVAPLGHPSVTWHRLPGVGRRAARAAVVRELRAGGERFDYLLTVDAGSEVHKDAVWQMLRVLNDPRVQACTGTVLTRDRHASLTARLSDLRLFVLCVLGRGLRSAVGAARPAPGGLSLYRAPVLSDHLEHYVASGDGGGDDDRQLCGYARARGRVISVPRAYVTADAPGTLADTYRQQLRRARAVRRLVPWELLALPASARTARLIELGAGALLPLLSLGLLADVRRTGSVTLPLHALAGVGVFTLAEALLYAVLRPGLSRTERLTAPLLAPLHAAMMFFVVHPATYRSLIGSVGRVGSRPTGRRIREAPATVPGSPAPDLPHPPDVPDRPNPPVRPNPPNPRGSSGTPSTPGTPETPGSSQTRRPPDPPRPAPPPGPAKLLDPLTEKTLETPLRTRTARPG
ncbi:hypothetical protein ACFRDV_09810 [Streptomyces fagopyri]|uniref:hypothetical protein n=1 Tax=Streptomyces fagopyri TaxID=2662397 RepID=UPI0036BE00B1